jgi:hypothetical protein
MWRFTLVIQARYQEKRELKKLVVQLAMEDFKFRVEHESERIKPSSAPVIVGYWDKIIGLVSKDELTPETMREVLEYDAKLKGSIADAYREWQQTKQTDV